MLRFHCIRVSESRRHIREDQHPSLPLFMVNNMFRLIAKIAHASSADLPWAENLPLVKE